MFKYIKYEIKGTYRYILGTMAFVLMLITGFYTYLVNASRAPINSIGFVSLLLGLTLFGTAVATFLYIVGSFRKELYEDRGYLTFTLPLTGKQIVGAKLTVAFIWFFLLGTVFPLYNLMMISIFNAAVHNLTEIFTAIAQVISFKQALFFIFNTVLKTSNFLLLVYFSITLSRVTFRNKKIGGLWFVLFLILSWLMSYGETKIASLLPYYLNLNLQSNNFMLNQLILNGMTLDFFHTGSLTANIASNIYVLVVTVTLFLATGYLIEKKIDL